MIFDRSKGIFSFAATLSLIVCGLIGYILEISDGMSLAKRLGENVRKLREAQGLSQEMFAEISGVHRTYLSGIERGARNCTLQVIDRLAKALRVPASDLLREDHQS